ncbi:hypothetical protein CSKR_200227 [Clonorchis sinensis]|uniref:Uncharacterized protein n=1 Tax=Clonorchis sinensis TaxID=79923 RepID=A0A8T1M0E9_CLOSI|nr:hypothetical protein CSKR_200227 [Clonorchis sinensis]
MGAAPPKKQFINYKQLMRDKAESKARAALLPVDTASTTVNKQVPLNKIQRKKKRKGNKGKQSENKVVRTKKSRTKFRKASSSHKKRF